MKKYSFICLMITMLTMAVGCGQTGTSSTNAKTSEGEVKKKALNIVLAQPFPKSDYRTKGFEYFAQEVEKRTNGDVKIAVHSGQSLVNLQDAFDAVSDGTVDMAVLASTFITNKVKDLTVLDITGSYDPEKWLEVEKEIHPIIQDILTPYNVKYLFPDYESGSVVTARKGVEPFKYPKDWKGYMIRDYGPYVGKAIKQWGGTPVNIPLSDYASAVQNKTVDGVFGGWPNVKSFKIYESTPVISYIGTSVLWDFMTMNMNAYNKLSDKQKKVFEEVGLEAAKKTEEFGKKEYEQFVEALKKARATYYVLTPEEKKAHTDALKPLYDEVAQTSGPNGKRLIEALKKLNESVFK